MLFCAATGNAGKLKEIRRILQALGHEVKSQKELGIHLDPEETGDTFEENAYIKAKAICDVCHLPTIADDSGLEVEALNGAPGIYSARYCGHHGDDGANNRKLMENMADVAVEKRGARFVSAVVLLMPDGRQLTAMGTCPGKIALKEEGTNGFGYDPLFIPLYTGTKEGKLVPNESERTYAQLEDWEKDAISHRGNAFRKLKTMIGPFLA